MAYYYIDYTNGSNSRSGLRIPAGDYNSTSYNTVDSTADTTHFVDSALTGADDYITGSYFYNVTRSAGSLITDFVALTDTVTLGTAITDMAAGDSYYILDAWLTTANYTSATTRTAGDIAYVRAGTTETVGATNIDFDEYGTSSSRISLIGCNATQSIDPWHDAIDTRPIVDFNNGAYYVIQDTSYWHIKNMKFQNSASTTAVVRFTASTGLLVENCVFTDGNTASAYVSYLTNARFRGCEFSNAATNALTVSGNTSVVFEDFDDGTHCTFENGANGTNYGVNLSYGQQHTIFKNCVFGAGGNFDTACIISTLGNGTFINCDFNGTKIYQSTSGTNTTGGCIYEEDSDGVFGYQSISHYHCTITKDTGVTRVGGSTSSAKLVPTSHCNIYNIASITDGDHPAFQVWCPSTATNIAVYIRAFGTWSPYPTANQLWVEAEYYSNVGAGTIAKTTTVSDEVLSDGTTWVAFNCAIAPVADSFVNVKVKHNLYQDASTGIYVDLNPIYS